MSLGNLPMEEEKPSALRRHCPMAVPEGDGAKPVPAYLGSRLRVQPEACPSCSDSYSSSIDSLQQFSLRSWKGMPSLLHCYPAELRISLPGFISQKHLKGVSCVTGMKLTSKVSSFSLGVGGLSAFKTTRGGHSWWLSGEGSAYQYRRHELRTWSGKIPHAMEQLGCGPQVLSLRSRAQGLPLLKLSLNESPHSTARETTAVRSLYCN